MAPRRRLQLVTTLAGSAFVFCVLHSPSLRFAQLPRAFPTRFRDRHGFFQVLRWLEHVPTADDLTAFLSAAAALNTPTPSASTEPFPTKDAGGSRIRSRDELLTSVALVVQWETYLSISKLVLQWGLLVFLSRAKAVTPRVAIPTICLCILSPLCAKVAHASLLQVLAADAASLNDRAAFMAAFLGLLFLLRLAAAAVICGIMARAYQVYFGGQPTHWKDLPRYLGSKNFALSTLFYGAAGVSVMSVSTPPLRSLSEAAYRIESLALVVAFSHFAAHELGLGLGLTTTNDVAMAAEASADSAASSVSHSTPHRKKE